MLKNVIGIKSLYEEFLENVKVFYAGNLIMLEIENIFNLEKIGNQQFYYPSYEELINYRQQAVIPNNVVMPNQEQIIKKKKDKEDDDWFFQFNK
jgi:hypothetical protein